MVHAPGCIGWLLLLFLCDILSHLVPGSGAVIGKAIRGPMTDLL
jgi:hypothetical protein